MTTVHISPEVQLQEMQQLVSHLQARNLFLAAKLQESLAIGFGLEKQAAELTARIAELEAAVRSTEQEDAG